MTICVAVKVAEGLVLAADSASMLQGNIGNQSNSILQTFSYANKVTHVKDYPIGVLSWGLGSIGDRSIQSLIMEWEYTFPSKEDNETFTVKDVADSLLAFIRTSSSFH